MLLNALRHWHVSRSTRQMLQTLDHFWPMSCVLSARLQSTHPMFARKSSTGAPVSAGQPLEEQTVMTVDRTSLYPDVYVDKDPKGKQPETDLIKHLKAIIHYRGGPMTVAEYMSESLTNAQHGYYIQQEVFGGKGDFITSPEVSQVYGELVGVWCVALWQQLGCPQSMRVVELGPGRGTLMADLLRGTSVFRDFATAVEVHLVEVSEALRAKQYQALACSTQPDGSISSGHSGAKVVWHRSLDEVPGGCTTVYICHEFLDALPVHQFQLVSRDKLRRVAAAAGAVGVERLSPLPKHRGPLAQALQSLHQGRTPRVLTPSLPTAHSAPSSAASASALEDAAAALTSLDLPRAAAATAVKPPMQQRGSSAACVAAEQQPAYEWRERLVDTDLESGTPYHFRFVVSPNDTPASTLLLKRRLQQLGGDAASLTALEICPQALALAQQLAQRVAADGGAALLIDYGREGPPYGDSLQALRQHDVVSPLDSPGTADLSAWVDFGAIRSEVEELEYGVVCHGPITQQHFLMGLGVVQRMQVLLEQAQGDDSAQQGIVNAVRRLVEGNETDGMGVSYKCMVLMREADDVPVPFASTPVDETT